MSSPLKLILDFYYTGNGVTNNDFFTYQKFSISQQSLNLVLSYDSTVLATLSYDGLTSTWVYIFFTGYKTSGVMSINYIVHNTRASADILNYSCSTNNYIQLNIGLNRGLIFSYVRLYDYAISYGGLLYNRFSILFPKTDRLVTYYDLRTFFKENLNNNSRTFYNFMDSTNAVGTNISISENTSRSAKNFGRSFNNDSIYPSILKSHLKWTNGKTLPLRSSTGFNLSSYNQFSLDLWLRFDDCPFVDGSTFS
jgi:hypothetical protein